jgi:hypothetical protein
MTVRQTLIVVYTITYSDGLLRELPFVRYFYERGFSQLGRLSAPESRVVIVTPEPIEASILDYHYRDLFGFTASAGRSARQRSAFLSPASRASLPLVELILEDPQLMAKLRDECDAGGSTRLLNFAASPLVELLGRTLGVPVEEGPHALARCWGSKSGSKKAFATAGVAAPLGSIDVLRSTDDVAAAAVALADESGAAAVVVKLDDADWGSAIGNAVIDTQILKRTGSLPEAVVQMLQPWADFAREISDGGALVEEYITCVSSSPSGQGYIETDGGVRVVSTHDQLVVQDEYVGCVYPASPEWRPEIRRSVARVGAALAVEGVRGTFGVDFIDHPDGRLLATEINVRKVGPTHVFDCVSATVPPGPHGWGAAGLDTPDCHYVHRRVNRPRELAGTAPAALIELLRREGLLFDRRAGAGVMLHALGALETCGYLETTCVAASRDAAEQLDALTQTVICDGVRGDVPEAVSS